jgi:LysM repeat protein
MLAEIVSVKLARQSRTAPWRRFPLLFTLLLAACTLPDPPPPAVPRATMPTILEITPAPTQDIGATATSFALQLVPTPTPSGLYIVQPGDTLSALAVEFGTTVDEIVAANGLTDPDALQAGQTLIIPSLTITAPAFATPTPQPADGAATPTLTPAPTVATP